MIGINLRTKCWDDDYCYASTKSVSHVPRIIAHNHADGQIAFVYISRYAQKDPWSHMTNVVSELLSSLLPMHTSTCPSFSNTILCLTAIQPAAITRGKSTLLLKSRIKGSWMRSSLNPTRQTYPRTARRLKSAHSYCGRSKCGICVLLPHVQVIGHTY